MGRKKVYGENRVSQCPFCGKDAYGKNPQGVPVCTVHVAYDLPDLTCSCGKWLDVRESKFGAFFTCMDCGAVSWGKMMEVNREKFLNAKPRRRVQEHTTRRPSSPFILDTIRKKIRDGVPLTPDELEFL